MKRSHRIGSIAVTVFVAALVGSFSWIHLRAMGSAFMPPSGTIASLASAESSAVPPIKFPEGFSLSVFAKGLGGPRVIALDPDNNLIISIPSKGKIVALPDRNGDGVADEVVTVAEGLESPHGLAFRCAHECLLSIAQTNRVDSYTYDRRNLKAMRRKKIADLPGGGGHSTRSLLFLPKPDDATLLVSVGSSCNVCVEKDERRAKILSVEDDGGTIETYASGLRNAVFMAVNPETNQVWATEMGRDYLGDDTPPDEINIIERGRDYGWPYCYGKNVHDSDFDPKKTHTCEKASPSQIDIPAHSAPLGIAFFPAQGWPKEYRGNFLVALHGSWNRSAPSGYKIVRYSPDGRGGYRARDFATGWLSSNDRVLGRPVAIVIMPDGRIFVSDDKAGVIYLIRITG